MSEQSDKLAKMLTIVQSLIAKADSTEFPEEAESFRNKAEALMFKYRIDEAMLGTEDKARYSIKPMMSVWPVAEMDSEFRNQFYWLAKACTDHVDGLITYKWGRHPDADIPGQWLLAEAYGYESDLLYAAMLFTSCRITFSARLEPKVVATESDEDNVYRLRNAGIERDRIAVLMGWAHADDIAKRKYGKSNWAGPEDVAAGIESAQRLAKGAMKASAMFKRACKARGEDPSHVMGKGNSVSTYRSSFAEGFVQQIRTRLWRLQNARGQEAGALVLRSRKADVFELYYVNHPDERPSAVKRAFSEPCPRCIAAKSGHCREHRPIGRLKDKPHNSNAAARGSEVANRVDLTGGNSPTPRAANAARPSQLEG